MAFPLSERISPTEKPTPEYTPRSGVLGFVLSADGTFAVEAFKKQNGTICARYIAWSRCGRYPYPNGHGWEEFCTDSVILADSAETALQLGREEAEGKGINFNT
jgi:hypothetical protein